MAAMYWEVFELLAGTFRHSDFVAFDRDLAALDRDRAMGSETGRSSMHVADRWLDGVGAIGVQHELEGIAKAAYVDRKLDGGTLASLRSNVTRLLDEIVAVILPMPLDTARSAYHVVAGAQSSLEDSRRREVERLLQEAEAGVAKITEKEAIADDALGFIGDSKLATHYKEYADNQVGAANKFRGWTIFVASLGGAAASVLLMGPSLGIESLAIDPGDYVHLIQRVVVTAALFGLAGYLARQAHQHRSLANWAGSLAVQLQTFDAFVSPVASPDVKDELRKTFAQRAFGEHPAMKGEPSVAPTSTAIENATSFAAKVVGGK